MPVRHPPNLMDVAEMLWVVLANVSGGDWSQQSAEWQAAAARWRDYYFQARDADTPSRLSCDQQPLVGALATFMTQVRGMSGCRYANIVDSHASLCFSARYGWPATFRAIADALELTP